ncbi:MAG TPA: hypothetical protein VLS93_16385 [Anaeromyxobacteraceae bacterium]|nr:hypothetical protein [Anaeromyxobacteraceae bacterium]
MLKVIWLPGFIAALIQPWLSDDTLGWRLLQVCAWGAGMILFWGTYGALKRVVAEESGLRVSNYLHEDVIPFGHVLSVTEWRWWTPRITLVRLGRASRFGSRILFVTPAPLILGDRAVHPVTLFIREQARMAQQDSRIDV